jgi:hypothetical protein
MLGVAAVASGAIWLRLASWAAVKLALPFDTAYSLAAWLSWLLPLGAVYILARHRAGDRVHRAQAARSARQLRTATIQS